MKSKSIAIVGAGCSGAVIAYHLARANHLLAVFKTRSPTAGNCHAERDSYTGVMVRKYGAL